MGEPETEQLTPLQQAKKARNGKIAALVATGVSPTEAGKQYGLSQRQSYRILSDKQCQDILDEVTRTQIAHAKGINKQFLKLCYDKDKKIKLDAIKQWQKNMGIAPTHTTNQFITTINNNSTQNQVVVPESYQEYMAWKRQKTRGFSFDQPQDTEQDVIDVTPDKGQGPQDIEGEGK